MGAEAVVMGLVAAAVIGFFAWKCGIAIKNNFLSV